MFGRTYFGKHYFGGSFFGPKGNPPAGSPIALVALIHRRRPRPVVPVAGSPGAFFAILHKRRPRATYPSGRSNVLAPSLNAIKGLLVNSGLFSSTSAMVSLHPQPFISPAPPCCAIAPGRFSFDQGLNVGGGRYEVVAEGEYVVRLLLRHTKDVATQDYQFLANANTGSYQLVEQVIDVLAEQFLIDTDGSFLSTYGLKPVSIGDPIQYSKDDMLYIVPVTFRTRLQLRLSLP